MQGVIIFKLNVINLVLDVIVIDVVKKGLFYIYIVEIVDDVLFILMEQEVGKISSKGCYFKNLINYYVVNCLYNIVFIVNGGDGEQIRMKCVFVVLRCVF